MGLAASSDTSCLVASMAVLHWLTSASSWEILAALFSAAPLAVLSMEIAREITASRLLSSSLTALRRETMRPLLSSERFFRSDSAWPLVKIFVSSSCWKLISLCLYSWQSGWSSFASSSNCSACFSSSTL